MPDENAVSLNLPTTGALKQRKRVIGLLGAGERLFKSVEWLGGSEATFFQHGDPATKAEVLLLNLVHGREPSLPPGALLPLLVFAVLR